MNEEVTAANARPRKIPGDAKRLDTMAWADAALTELAESGIDGVRVEVLAKRLAVTKGSFYWHFKDRDALLAVMLDRWRKRATLALIQRLDQQESTPADRLRSLLRLPLKGARAVLAAEIELAIRLWSRRDLRARNALSEVDELRLRYIEGLLTQLGFSAEEARARAVLAYSYQRVASTLVDPADDNLRCNCELILAGPGG